MSELLAPAGSMESLKAAIANGCDAVYLGLKKYGARAYSSNFDDEALLDAVAYAHLRDVKVYVTINTIAFENELADIYQQLHFLNEAGVDGVIAQDLAILTYVAQHFEDMEAHCSTQMGIDDLEGTLLAKELGAKRVVISREVPIQRVKKIRQQADLPLEAFVHGALCVSYSGNCIMSGMTGNRSGNRGRCIGSCRKLYDIVNVTTGQSLGRNYILSTKDLNTIDHASELEGIDSLKIEGRMKEPIYVANVVSRYRMALDGAATKEDTEKLNRTFNRTYTEGYLFGEDHGNITNVDKPNHHGYRIGTVVGFRKGVYEIALSSPLKQNDLIRIRHKNEDVNLAAAKIYDAGGRLINGADKGDSCFIKVKEKLSNGDAVYKTKDIAYEKELESKLDGEFRRFPLDMAVYARPGAPLVVTAEGLGEHYTYEGDEILSEAVNQPTALEAVVKQLSRLNDTVFRLGEVTYEDCNAFIPAKMLNAARKDIVEHLYEQKIASKPRRVVERTAAAAHAPVVAAAPAHAPAPVAAPAPTPEAAPVAAVPEAASTPALTPVPYLTALATTQEQYDACKEAGIETVYFRNVVPRNNAVYRDIEGDVLVGGMGGIQHYRTTNPFVTDYSLNVVNSVTVRELQRLGAKRITLSYEINEGQLGELLEGCAAATAAAAASATPDAMSASGVPVSNVPASNAPLEMIVYGHAPLLVTRYCPLKQMGQCGSCRTNRYEIREEYGTFPILSHDNCDTTILNGKRLNLLDEMPRLTGIEAFRLNFTIESADEVREIIALAKGKLEGTLSQSAFNAQTDTRGYFNKEIL